MSCVPFAGVSLTVEITGTGGLIGPFCAVMSEDSPNTVPSGESIGTSTVPQHLFQCKYGEHCFINPGHVNFIETDISFVAHANH
jgi:hypothetical protein